jgi:hypothetical protein
MTSTTTPTTWVTIDEAAALLGISGRQVQRRIASGQMQAQRREDGRTLVAVPASDTASGVALQLHEQADAARRLADLVERSTGLAVQQMQERLTEQAEDVRRLRRIAWRGWAAAGLAFAGLAATLSWAVMASDARTANAAQQAALRAAEGRRIDAVEDLIRMLGASGQSDTLEDGNLDCPTEMSHHVITALSG